MAFLTQSRFSRGRVLSPAARCSPSSGSIPIIKHSTERCLTIPVASCCLQPAAHHTVKPQCDAPSSLYMADDTSICRDQKFELKADYSADSPVPQGVDSAVGRFIVGPAKAAANGEKPKLKVRERHKTAPQCTSSLMHKHLLPACSLVLTQLMHSVTDFLCPIAFQHCTSQASFSCSNWKVPPANVH